MGNLRKKAKESHTSKMGLHNPTKLCYFVLGHALGLFTKGEKVVISRGGLTACEKRALGKLRKKAINLKRGEIMRRYFASLFLGMLGAYSYL